MPVQTTVGKQSSNHLSLTAELPATEGETVFSSLLDSLATGTQQASKQTMVLLEDFLEEIESTLVVLQERPSEELTEAQQEIMYELLQLVNLQEERKESTFLIDTPVRKKPISILPDAEKQTILRLQKSLASNIQQAKNQEVILPEDLIEQIESVLMGLQEQPEKELTAAQQEIMHEMMYLINLQADKKDNAFLSEIVIGRKNTSVLPDIEKQTVFKEVQAKLVDLVKKLSDILPTISTGNTKQFDAASAFMGVEENKPILKAETIEKVTNLIREFTESLTAIEKKIPEAAMHSNQLAKFGMVFTAETEKHPKVMGDIKIGKADESETLKVQQTTTVIPAARSDGEQQDDTSRQDTNKQSLVQTTSLADSAKSTVVPAQPVQARPEPPLIPTPIVRMNNLTAELGEVFKNSLRMSTNGESMQIKVNISPDHLGHLDIRLTETNGKIAAQIFTSSLAAKDALDLQLHQLRNTFIQQGLTVEKVEVLQHSSHQSLGQQNTQSEQRFIQHQRKNTTGRDTNGYQQIEEKTANERNYSDSGMIKVDYTV